MNNLTLIERLNDIKEQTTDMFARNQVSVLISDLKAEEIAKGYKGGEAERHKVSVSFQKMMFKKPRPVLALWHKNAKDNKYYFTNSAIMVRVSEDDFFKDLHTTTETFTLYKKSGFAYYQWKGEANLYPCVDNCWVDGKEHKEIEIDMPSFMAWLHGNSKEQYAKLIIKEEVSIKFDLNLIMDALIMSKVAQQKGKVVLKYIGEMSVFQFGDDCLCTPIRDYGSGDYVAYEVK